MQESSLFFTPSTWLTYLQVWDRDADIENRLVDTAGEGGGGMNLESIIETYHYRVRNR